MDISSSHLKTIENQCAPIIREAGNKIRESWNSIQDIQYKSTRDPVTEVDRAVEDFIREKVRTIVPEAGFLVEEGTSDKHDVYNWSIDPIDGTKYFVHQAPLFVTQLALLKNDVPVMGIIYNPISDQLFSASQGNEATMNGNVLKVLERNSLHEAIVDVDFGGVVPELDIKNRIFSQFSQQCNRIRMLGGPFSIYAANGAIDICVGFNHIKLYDRAPRDIILREAGMTVDYLEKEGYTGIRLAATPALFELAAQVIKTA